MHFHWNLVKMHLPHVLFLIFSLDICPFVFCVLIILNLFCLGLFLFFFLFIEIESHCAFQADFAELELQVSTTLSSSVTEFLKFLLHLFCLWVVCACMYNTCVSRSENNLWGLIFFFSYFFYFSPPCWS